MVPGALQFICQGEFQKIDQHDGGSVNAGANAFPVKGDSMKETRLTIPELALIAGTRAALGGGLAFLLCAVHAHVLAGCKSLSQPDGGEV